MKKTLAFAAVALSVVALTVPAVASTPDQIGLCVEAFKAEGIAPQGEFRSKFVKSRGASVKTLIIDLVPDDGETVTGSCKIARGKVAEVARA